MIHRKAMSLMSTAEAIAQTATTALSQATSQQTGPTGSTVTHNADGTKTISGSVLGTDSTGTSVGVAQFVGDTTAPGKPTGVTATSKSGVVIVSWDGTLEGGVPSDFDHITVMMDDVELGCLKRAGSVTSGKHDAGTVVSITATAQDAARLEDGSLSPNVSAATDSISVTVVDESLELSRGNAKSIASINNHFWSDDSGAHVSHSDHSTDGANYLITSTGAAVCDGTDQLNVTSKDGNDVNVKGSDGTLTNVAHFGTYATIGNRESESAIGNGSFAQGDGVVASGVYSFAEGSMAGFEESYGTVSSCATGACAHAEGASTASGDYSHSEERGTASGLESHAEGGSTASGDGAHAEGGVLQGPGTAVPSWKEGSVSSGLSSHSEGNGTIANHLAQHVHGQFNVADPSTADSTQRGTFIEIIGNGTSSMERSNARTLDWSGKEWTPGGFVAGGTSADSSTVGITPDGVIVDGTTYPIGNLAYVLSRKVLFDSDSQAFGVPVTLSESSANFSDLRVYFRTDDGAYSSLDVHDPDGKIITCTTNWKNGSNQMFVKSTSLKISGTTMSTYNDTVGWCTGVWGSSMAVTTGDYIKVVRVVGWKG